MSEGGRGRSAYPDRSCDPVAVVTGDERQRVSTHKVALIIEHLVVAKAALVPELVALGVSESTVRRMRRGGLLVGLGRNVVGLRAEPDRFAQRCAAALALHSGAVLSHQTAAQLQGLPIADDDIHLTTRHGARRKGDGIVLHRTAVLEEPDWWTRGQHCLTRPDRTVCDLAAVATSDEHYRWLVMEAVARALVPASRLLACHARLSGSGRLGNARRRAVLFDLLDDSLLVAASRLEHRFRTLVTRAGIPGVVLPFHPPWFDGRYGIVDAALPAAKVIVELDGRRWHATLERFDNDRARDRAAAERGWRVLRFSWADVVDRPATVVSSLRTVVS